MFRCHPQLEQDSHTLGDFPLCRLLLINDTQYPWLVLVPKRDNIKEIHQLDDADRAQFHTESHQLSRELMRVFSGDKLNVAALGNMVPQLHVHHIVRFTTDAAWPAPVWGKHPMQAYSDEALRAFKQRFAECVLDAFIAC